MERLGRSVKELQDWKLWRGMAGLGLVRSDRELQDRSGEECYRANCRVDATQARMERGMESQECSVLGGE